nr:unnamed protein product [Digitaria exilis]
MSTLLAPGAKYDCPSVDYWNAIGVPSDIDKYDWAEYVIRKLFDAVLKVKSDLKGNVKGPLITGCTLFLQLRDPLEVCYSWAAMARADLQLDSLSDDEKFWEAGASLVRSLRAPAEAVGPLYFALVDSRRQTNKILCNAGIRAMSVYFQIMEIFMMGFRYNTVPMVPELGIGSVRTISSFSWLEMQHVRMGLTDVGTSGIRSASSGSESVNTSAAGSGINPLVRERCVDSFPRSPEHEWGNIFFDGCGHKFVHESPIWIFKDCMVMRAMAQYFLSVRAMKLSRGFELNTDARMLEDGAQLTARKISEKTEAAKRPFELGQSRHFVAMEDGQVIQFLSRVESEVESLRPWIVQYTPKYIEVLGAGLKMQISGFCEMEMDFFDAAIRRLKEIDERLNRSGFLCVQFCYCYRGCDVGTDQYIQVREFAVICRLVAVDNLVGNLSKNKNNLVASAQGGGRENLINLYLEHIIDDEDSIIARPSAACEIHHILHLHYESFVPKRKRSRAEESRGGRWLLARRGRLHDEPDGVRAEPEAPLMSMLIRGASWSTCTPTMRRRPVSLGAWEMAVAP